MLRLKFLLIFVACTGSMLSLFCIAQNSMERTPTNAKLYRPAFHFSPQRNWINDPTGMVYDGGKFHLFNQYNPFGDQWGHMSWSHSVSSDLLHWQELPVALNEENGVMIFTGSTVIDTANTSGFGKDGIAPMVAFYTGMKPGSQAQNLAYSTDHGHTWTKYVNNPVLDLHEAEFRDPMVFWHEPSRHWVMVVSLAVQHKILFYSSPDLKSWTKMSEFGPAGANGAPNWECPNLFSLPVENIPGETKWVLELGIGDNGPAGGSASQYFVGDFDGTKFTNDNPDNKTLWVDYGSDFYAGQTFSTMPSTDGRRIAIAWMDNWNYASKLPTSPWRGQTATPRTLGLVQTPDGIRLTQVPVREIESLRDEHAQLRNASWKDLQTLLGSREWPETLEIVAEFQIKDTQEFGLVLRKGGSFGTRVGYSSEWGNLYIDRTRAGDLVISPSFTAKHEAPFTMRNGRVQMHILLDRSSVEMFADNGLLAMTDLIFPRSSDKELGAYAKGNPPSVVSLDIWTLKADAEETKRK